MEKYNSDNKQLLRIKELEENHAFGSVGTYYLDYDNQLVYPDRTLCSMYGLEFNGDGISLNKFLQNIIEEDEQNSRKIRHHKIKNREPYEVEYRVKVDADKVRWLLARARPKQVEERLIYEGIVVDITKGKEADLALQTQNKLIKTITDNATSALFMMNEKGIVTFMNPAAEEMFGYSFEEISSKPLHYLIHHHYPDGTPYPMEDCPLDRALPQNFEMRAHEDLFFRKNGTSFPVLCAASPIFENGIPVATVIEVRDISEQKNAEVLLNRHTERLEILNNIGSSISEELDVQGILQKVTDATTQLTGADFGAFFYNAINSSGESYVLYTLSGAPLEAFEKLGMPRNTAVFHPTFIGEGVVRVDDITKDARYGKSSPHFGMPKGHLPVVSYLAVPVVSKSGKVIGGLFFGHKEAGVFNEEHEKIVIGVTSQAAIALDNAKLYEEVKVLNAKKDEFIGLASHELKTPLTSINGYLQLLERNETNSTNKIFIQKTINQVKKLSSLVSDLLDVSKIQAGKLELNFEKFNFNDILSEAKEIVEISSKTHAIILQSTVSKVIYADKQRIEQVIINLLTNAIKYSPHSDKVLVTTEIQGEVIRVNVKDFGIGIEKDQQAKIFSRFYRVEGLNPSMSGLGIGLYISAEIIRRHGGLIGVESAPGNGSTFWFTLPIKPE